jgi:hypothetical protein
MPFLNAMLYIAMAFASASPQNPSFEWNKKSTLSAEYQVEFPGLVLDPGIYIVRLREGGEKRSLVEILNRDETQLLATIVAVPDHRVRPEDNSDFTFHETKREGPRPVQSWFYTGDLVGLEFIYPMARAKEIAKQTDCHVMASDGKNAIVAVTPNGKEIVIDGPTQAARRNRNDL